MTLRTLISNGLLLLDDEAGWKLEKKDVIINDNRIEQITASPAQGEFDSIIDAHQKLVMPGLINSHTHAYMTIHRNYADDLDFFTWLDNVDKVEQNMTEEDVYWTTKLAIIEMLKSGTTCFVDMAIKSAKEKYGPKSAVAGAVCDSGFRAVICRGLAGSADSDESLQKYGEAVYEMELFKGESRISFFHGPHAPYSCEKDYLQKLANSCRKYGIGQHIHLSESKTEMELIAKNHDGMTPIQYVDSVGVFDVPCVVAHAVYATKEDIEILKNKNVSVAICPKSNMKLGNGFAPVESFLEKGVNVCLGTDGCGSSNDLNMFGAMNAAALVYKGTNQDAKAVSAADVLKMATLNGAKMLGQENELGTISEGAIADLILIDLKVPQFIPANNIISGLVYSSNGSEVDTVMVDGKILMENRKLTTIDENQVYEEIEKITNRLQMKSAAVNEWMKVK